MKYLYLLFGLLLFSLIIQIPAQQTIEVYVEVIPTTSRWSFVPDQIVMVQNHPIQMIYNNTDKLPHDFNADDEGGRSTSQYFLILPHHSKQVMIFQ